MAYCRGVVNAKNAMMLATEMVQNPQTHAMHQGKTRLEGMMHWLRSMRAAHRRREEVYDAIGSSSSASTHSFLFSFIFVLFLVA